jgi:serine/threonine-protein kinase
MSIWARLKRHLAGEDDDEDLAAPPLPIEPARAPPAPASDPIAAFGASIGAPDGPDEARVLGWIRDHRGTTAEGAVVRALAEAAPRATEPVRVATAELLASRGEEAMALEVLEGVGSAAGLVLAADLLASSGRLPRAIGAIERVLAKELDAPGARERHARWRAALGLGAPAAGRHDEATVVQPAGDDAPFRVVREVARGGAGTVYEAEDELLGRRLAFKVHHRRGADRPALEREVRASVELAGPGVLRLFDASPAQGWVAFEWIGRGSVRDVLRRGDAALLADVDAWIAPLARALARVHQLGWVHGDVKPGNVLLRSPRDPVLGDLGLARRVGAAAVGGSPGYVSPERLGGRPVDPRDDVYGFGRVVEDVLDALAREGATPPARARRIAELCMRPEERRPADGLALLALLAATHPTQPAVHL